MILTVIVACGGDGGIGQYRLVFKWLCRIIHRCSTKLLVPEIFFATSKENTFKNVTHGFHEDIDGGHGRIEVRRAYVLDFEEYKKEMLKLDVVGPRGYLFPV